MQMLTKFIEIEGEVVKRIANPEQISKKGQPYRVNYLVVKWVTGQTGQYIDYVPIKVMEYKKIADLREGYKVRATVRYSCRIDEEIGLKINTKNYGGVETKHPQLYPEFSLSANAEIEILDSKNDYEANSEPNNLFEKEVIKTLNPDENDLLF